MKIISSSSIATGMPKEESVKRTDLDVLNQWAKNASLQLNHMEGSIALIQQRMLFFAACIDSMAEIFQSAGVSQQQFQSLVEKRLASIQLAMSEDQDSSE